MTTLQGDGWDDEPCFVISVASRMLQIHSQTLRYYEREGLLEPARSRGNIRLYSQRDIERLRRIKTLTEDLGLNLAGVQVVLRLMDQMGQMESRIRELTEQVVRLQAARGQGRGRI